MIDKNDLFKKIDAKLKKEAETVPPPEPVKEIKVAVK